MIGAGFAGLACARAAARRGLRVIVIDRKREPGVQMHTTGLVVKEAAVRALEALGGPRPRAPTPGRP